MTEGAANDGVAVLAFRSVMPCGAAQTYDMVLPSGSEEDDPSRVTVAPSGTDWSLPASAAGGWLTFRTVTVIVSVSVAAPSETARVMVYGVSDVTEGAVNDGVAALAFRSVMP